MATGGAAGGIGDLNPTNSNAGAAQQPADPGLHVRRLADDCRGEQSLYRDAKRIERFTAGCPRARSIRRPSTSTRPTSIDMQAGGRRRRQEAHHPDRLRRHGLADHLGGGRSHRRGKVGYARAAERDCTSRTTRRGTTRVRLHRHQPAQRRHDDRRRHARPCTNPGGTMPGGYDAEPRRPDPGSRRRSAVPDRQVDDRASCTPTPTSSSSATSHDAPASRRTTTPSTSTRRAAGRRRSLASCSEQGYAVGVVTSVPISHATPACGLRPQRHPRRLPGPHPRPARPAVDLHPEQPLPGLDVLIGGGWGDEPRNATTSQGDELRPRQPLPDRRRLAGDRRRQRRQVRRRPADAGAERARSACRRPPSRRPTSGKRLLRLLRRPGTAHLPFRTADGDYRSGLGRRQRGRGYTAADIAENPTLADMAARRARPCSRRSAKASG